MCKTKIVVFHPALAPYRIDFFNKIAQNFDATFYFTYANLQDQKFDQKKLRGGSRFTFNLLSSGFDFNSRSMRFGIFKIIRDVNPGIIFCSEYSQITFAVLIYKILLKSSLKVYTISDDSLDLSVSRKGIRKIARSIASNYLDGVIFPSKQVCGWYSKNVNSKPQAIELPIVHSNNVFREKLNESLIGIDEKVYKYKLNGKKVFLFVGRLVKIKNPILLIRAFAKRKNKNDILVIIGAGEEFEALSKLILELGLSDSCLLLGRFEGRELMVWFNIAQCLILPSYQEPYGVVVNEALLAGCKVICSALAGASTLINDDNGYLFDPKDELQLTALIDKVSKELSPLQLPIKLKSDLMPFTLDEKIWTLFSQI
ncbi:glycosyltransferase [Sunxiuqinia sp. A32]|uniref:glycosyltransferase n=1 Tax=Sunxiuqinia sp. A32 TaxID=3461496 RepID=UPI004045D517